jgi:hypothetical protein
MPQNGTSQAPARGQILDPDSVIAAATGAKVANHGDANVANGDEDDDDDSGDDLEEEDDEGPSVLQVEKKRRRQKRIMRAQSTRLMAKDALKRQISEAAENERQQESRDYISELMHVRTYVKEGRRTHGLTD